MNPLTGIFSRVLLLGGGLVLTLSACGGGEPQGERSTRQAVFDACGETRTDAQIDALIGDTETARDSGATRAGMLALVLAEIDLESPTADEQIDCTLALLDHVYGD